MKIAPIRPPRHPTMQNMKSSHTLKLKRPTSVLVLKMPKLNMASMLVTPRPTSMPLRT